MPTNEENQGPQRRIVMRRGRGAGGSSAGGFSSGSSTRSESLRASDADVIEDEVDDAIDPSQVHNRIVQTVRTQPRQPQAHASFDTDEPGAPDPRSRMHQVANAGSASYSKEYRQTLLHRLLMRRVPLDQIAQQLGVSISTIEKDRVELKERLRVVARELDINVIVGGQMETYAELSAMSLRIATKDDTPTAMKLAAMRTTLAAEADKTRFLNTAGVFDVLRFRKAEDGSDVSDIQLLMQNTAAMFDRLMDSTDDEAPARAPTRARRPARPAPQGFGKLTMDDTDASSGDAEEVEL